MSRIQRIYQDVLPQELSIAQQRSMEIIEASIKCFATVGIDGTTYERIAKAGKLSRPLIFRYFKDKETIFESAVKYIRSNMQIMAVEALSAQDKPEKQLEAYVRSTFQWMEAYPDHASVWKLFYFQCENSPKLRALNTELVRMGHSRITEIIENGKTSKIFRCKSANLRARTIQIMITGALVSATTENAEPGLKIKVDALVEDCLALAKIP